MKILFIALTTLAIIFVLSLLFNIVMDFLIHNELKSDESRNAQLKRDFALRDIGIAIAVTSISIIVAIVAVGRIIGGMNESTLY